MPVFDVDQRLLLQTLYRPVHGLDIDADLCGDRLTGRADRKDVCTISVVLHIAQQVPHNLFAAIPRIGSDHGHRTYQTWRRPDRM